MKAKYSLPGLNADNAKTNKGLDKKKQYGIKVSLFYNNPNSFYREYCENLDNSKIREKRFLEFETPNRAFVTHEYDMEINDDFDYSKYYYLFNPITRLSWLKISQEGKRLSIAGEKETKRIVQDILNEELSCLSNPQKEFEDLWERKKGFPCFIKLEDGNCKNFLLSASYYDSLRRDKVYINSSIKDLFYPLLEREIKYEYYPLKMKTSWLYIKAPKDFNIRHNKKKTIFFPDNNKIDYINSEGMEADPDKIALTIKNRKVCDTNDYTVTINFDIIVPSSLKVWFLSIYYLSFIALLFLVLNFFNKLLLLFIDPIFLNDPIGKTLKGNDLGGMVFAIIAAIIATRGWMISEETILRKYSIFISIIMCAIIFFYIVNLLII
ncbi:MAG: hypothetical protein M0O93_06090 [Bacteroidales bacterium]|nr:hypothetical protein [Bacteroidales bacterium]